MNKKLFLLIILIFLFFNVSCIFNFEVQAVFYIPDELKCKECLIEYIDTENKLQSFIIKGEKSFYLTVNKNYVVPVLCYSLENENSSYPWGIIYPFTNMLNEKDGFTSSVLCGLYTGSNNKSEDVKEFLSCFNWKRFLEECRLIENPWNLNKEEIMKRIASRTFTLSYLK